MRKSIIIFDFVKKDLKDLKDFKDFKDPKDPKKTLKTLKPSLSFNRYHPSPFISLSASFGPSSFSQRIPHFL